VTIREDRIVTSQVRESRQPEPSGHHPKDHSYASQQACISEARTRLLEGVIEFLRKMKKGGESQLGRNPFSEDLIPYFQRYAWSVIEARYKEQIVTATSLSQAQALIRESVDAVIETICKKRELVDGKTRPAGVWLRTIKHACKAVDLGTWITAFGTYDQTVFLHPQRRQLRSLLLVQAHELVTEFWNRKAIEGASPVDAGNQSIGPESAHMEFPDRAKWLQDRISERDWNLSTFESRQGPDRKTIRRIINGIKVSEMSLRKVAKALSTSKLKNLGEVRRSDIPDS
jgi:hypothetical protein